MDVAETNEMKKLSRWFSLKNLRFVAAGVILLPVIYFFVIKYAFHDSQKECTNILCAICCDACDLQSERNDESWITPGTLGDMFGALTCLFTGLGIIGVLLTWKLQYLTLNHMRDESKEQYKQTERHWFFTIVSGIALDWDKDNGDPFKEKIRSALEVAILAEEERKGDVGSINCIWNLAVQARSALRRYNVIPYNLTISTRFEYVEKEDIIAQTLACLPEDLRFCLSMLYLNGALPDCFCCKDLIVNDNKIEKELLEVCAMAVNHRDSARAVLCQLKCIGRLLVNPRL